MAYGISISTAKIFIPCLHKGFLLFFNYTPNLFQLKAVETATVLKANRIEPVLCDLVISFNMYVMRLIAITGIKKESIGTGSEYSWHSIHLFTAIFFTSNAELTSGGLPPKGCRMSKKL